MSQVTQASIADVAHSVCSLDSSEGMPVIQASKIIDSTLRTVIGMNCLGDRSVEIDLGNGHTLCCSVKKAIGPTDV